MGQNYSISLPPFTQQQYIPPQPSIQPTGPQGALTWADIQCFLSSDAQALLQQKQQRHLNRTIHWAGTIVQINPNNTIGVKMNPSLSENQNQPDVIVKMPVQTQQFMQFSNMLTDFTGTIVSIDSGVATVEYQYYGVGPQQASVCPAVGNQQALNQLLTNTPLSYCEFIKDASPIIIQTIIDSLKGKQVAFTSQVVKIEQQKLQAILFKPICSQNNQYDVIAELQPSCKLPPTLKPAAICTIFGNLSGMLPTGQLVVQAASIAHHNNANASIQKLPTTGGRITWDQCQQRIMAIRAYGDQCNQALSRLRGQQIASPIARGITPPMKSITPPNIRGVTPPKIVGPKILPKVNAPVTPPAIDPQRSNFKQDANAVTEPAEEKTEPQISQHAENHSEQHVEQPNEQVNENEENNQDSQNVVGEQSAPAATPAAENQMDVPPVPEEPKVAVFDEETGQVKLLDEIDSEFRGKDPSEVAAQLMKDAPKTSYTETAISANLFRGEEDDALSRLRKLKQKGVISQFESAAEDHLAQLNALGGSKPPKDDYYQDNDYYGKGDGNQGGNDYYGGGNDYYSGNAASNNYYGGNDYYGGNTSGGNYNAGNYNAGNDNYYNNYSSQQYDQGSNNGGSQQGYYDSNQDYGSSSNYGSNYGNGGNNGW